LGSNNINIIYTNADGLLNKRQELKLYINSLEKKPHIIAINEVKPKHLTHNLLTSEFNLEGYHIFFPWIRE